MTWEYYNNADDALFVAGGDYIEDIGDTSGQSGRWTMQGTGNGYRRSFAIVTKDQELGPIPVGKALKHIGILIGSVYSLPSGGYDPYVRATDVSVDQDSAKPTQWTATVSYGPVTWSAIDGGNFSNPLDLIPIPVWIGEKGECPLVRDFADDPVLNSAEDRYSPPITREFYRKVMVYERNEADFSEALADVWRNTVNLDVWNGWPAKTVCCRNITGTPDFHPIIGVYYKVRYEFEFWDGGVTGPDVATKWVLDAGWNEIVGGEKIPILNSDNTFPSEIPLLNGSGGRLGTGGTPVFNEVQYRDTVDFTGLNILLF